MTLNDCVKWLQSEDGFVPRAACGEWSPGLMGLHRWSDLAIFGAYIGIPIIILFFAVRQRVPFRPLALSFSIFILLCGIGHLLEYFVFEHAVYRLIGVWKAATACASWATVMVFAYYASSLLHMKMPNEYQVQVRRAADAEAAKVQAEIAVRHMTENLKQKVEEQTQVLARQNMILKEADRAKTEFLGMLAHELRNPLAPISTSIHILRHGQNSRAREDAQQMIERQVHHLSGLVEGLLDHQRMTRGKLLLKRKTCSVQRILKQVHEAIGLVQSQEERPVRMYLNMPKDDIWVDADARRLEQAFENMMGNGVKFSKPDGNLWVEVSQQPGHVVVRVRDDGLGIEADLLPHVCDPFVQGKQSFDRPHGGLGIGLAISKYTVTAHGGTMSVSSPGQNRGTTVSVRLPTTEPPEVTEAVAVSERELPGTVGVLIVDDNSDAAESLAICLRMYGYNVIGIATSGPAALELVRAERPDIILLDLGLPGMDGYQIGRSIRTTRPDCVLVAVTGYGRDEDRARTTEIGFNHHLIKPIDPEVLRDVIDNYQRRGP